MSHTESLPELNNVGIVVEDLDDAIAFFQAIGLTLEGRTMVEGEWAGRVTGLGDQSVEIAMVVTPDGHSRLELSRFIRPGSGSANVGAVDANDAAATRGRRP